MTNNAADSISSEPPHTKPERRRTLLIALIGLVVFLGIAGPASASILEEQDQFCASCHMVPERTYFNRTRYALAGVEPALDLSSQHYADDLPDHADSGGFRCIDCHRGNHSIPHRATALALGLRDATIYVMGAPDQQIEKMETVDPNLIEAACIDCHEDTLVVVGFPNHFHNALPQASEVWQEGAELQLPSTRGEFFQEDLEAGLEPIDVSLRCQDCHQAHVSIPGAEFTGFMNIEAVVFPTCEECHIEALDGPIGLATLRQFDE